MRAGDERNCLTPFVGVVGCAYRDLIAKEGAMNQIIIRFFRNVLVVILFGLNLAVYLS